MVLGLTVPNGVAALVSVPGPVTGVYNRLAWGPVATFATFTIAFLLVGRPAMPRAVIPSRRMFSASSPNAAQEGA